MLQVQQAWEICQRMICKVLLTLQEERPHRPNLPPLQEALYLERLINDLDECESTSVITMYNNNQGTISLSHNPGSHARTKHIDVKYNFIREHVQKGHVRLSYVPSQMMLADFLIKPIGRQLRRVCEIIFQV